MILYYVPLCLIFGGKHGASCFFFVINRADVVLFLEIIRDISGFFCLCDFDYKDIFIYPTTIVVIVILYHRQESFHVRQYFRS